MSEARSKNQFADIVEVFEPKPPGRGCLISLDGFDGSGKSTQVHALARRLIQAGHSVITTREPTDWYRNDPMVKRFHSEGGSEAEARVLSMMAAVDRHRHVAEVIKPALASGATVICDRYVCSTFAVFAHRGVDLDFVVEINKWVPRPHCAFYLDVPTDILLDRLRLRDGAILKFEEKAVERVESIISKWNAMRGIVEFIEGIGEIDTITQTLFDRVRTQIACLEGFNEGGSQRA